MRRKLRKISIDNQIKKIFDKFNLGLNDFQKVLNATDKKGHGANFAVAMVGMAVTEPIAKICNPYIDFHNRKLAYAKRKREHRQRGKITKRQDLLEDIVATEAVLLFWKRYFENKRYYQLGRYIWDAFRHGNVHLFLPKKIVDVPIKKFDYSFLSGVHWPGRLVDIEIDTSLSGNAKSEHLNFFIAGYSKRGNIPRPAFRFVPHIYYKDLVNAVREVRLRASTNKSLRKRLLIGWELFSRAYKSSLKRYPLREQKLITKELKKLANSI
jgi:hypothetical protein